MTNQLDHDVRRILSDIAAGGDAKLNGVGAAYIINVLARPALPEEPSREFIRDTFKDWPLVIDAVQSYHHALYARLTKPKTKKVWRVEGAARTRAPYSHELIAETREELRQAVDALHADGFGLVTIRNDEMPS